MFTWLGSKLNQNGLLPTKHDTKVEAVEYLILNTRPTIKMMPFVFAGQIGIFTNAIVTLWQEPSGLAHDATTAMGGSFFGFVIACGLWVVWDTFWKIARNSKMEAKIGQSDLYFDFQKQARILVRNMVMFMFFCVTIFVFIGWELTIFIGSSWDVFEAFYAFYEFADSGV